MSGQRILTKGHITGVDFTRGQCTVAPASPEPCSWLQQSLLNDPFGCMSLLSEWSLLLCIHHSRDS